MGERMRSEGDFLKIKKTVCTCSITFSNADKEGERKHTHSTTLSPHVAFSGFPIHTYAP